MLLRHHHLLLLSTLNTIVSVVKNPLSIPTSHYSLTLHAPDREPLSRQEGENNEEESGGYGPIEMMQPFNYSPSIFSTSYDPSPIQVSSSVLFTGIISVSLNRSLRRLWPSHRAKELVLFFCSPSPSVSPFYYPVPELSITS